MSDTWLITITTTSPLDALLLAFQFEGCKVEWAARSNETAGEAVLRAHAGSFVSASTSIPAELRFATAANDDGWPEY